MATRVLAEYVAAQHPGKRVLVISNPFTRERGHSPQIYAYEEAGIAGLRKGLGNAQPMKVVFPALRPEVGRKPGSVYVDPKTTTPLSFLVAEDAFDALAKENSDFDIVVSLIGLPVNVSRAGIWQNPAGPKFALLLPDLRFIGQPEAVRAAIKSGKIVGAVLKKPGAPPEATPVDGDYKSEFAKRFVLATTETVDQLLQVYPQLF